MRGRLKILFAATVAAATLGTGATPATALDTQVESFDGTKITTHYYRADGLKKGKRAPTILIGHGWGGTGEGRDGSPAAFLAKGYNVLTWDARGFGTSEGIVQIDDPRFEARDVSALIDFVAKRRSAKLDRKGDPRVGMSGASYGGGIQLITAATDKRVDVIAPTIPWHNLLESLYPRKAVKAGWDLALVGAGIPTATVPQGYFDPAGIPNQGGQSEHFYDAVIGGLSTGQIPDSQIGWFQKHGPDYLLKKIKVPTLIAQGTVDTLFDLTQGHRNYQALKKNQIPLKMMWFCGGHGVCTVDSDSDSAALGDSKRVQKRRLQWFDRYLKGKRKQRTGPAFEWIDQNAKWHKSAGYPLRKTGKLKGSGSGTVPLTPGPSPATGALVVARRDPTAPIKIDIPAKGGEDVVGAPKLRFTYRALGVPTTRDDGITHIYGQIVDKDRNVVAGNQATPIPIKIDNKKHRVRIGLTRIASDAPAAGYQLQIVSQSSLFDVQRVAGAVTIDNLKVTLPKTKPRKRG